MRISSFEWKLYSSSLSDELIGNRVSKICHFDNGVFSLCLSNGKTMLLVLNGEQPRVYVSPNSFSSASLNSSLATAMRKNLSNAKIEDLEILNEDSILSIKMAGTNDIFQPVSFFLVAELIPFKGNLILLDDGKKVLASLYSASLDSPRPLFHGLSYQTPANTGAPTLKRDPIPFDEMVESWLKEEDSIREKRKNGLYASVFAKAKKNIKTLENRLKAIDGDITAAEKHLLDAEYGNFIYTVIDEIDPRLGYFDYYGEKIPLNENYSAAKNAEIFFKRYKKAKATIGLAKERKAKTLEELEEAKSFLRILNLSSEEDLMRYSKDLGTLETKGSQANYHQSTSFFPHECFVDGVRYVFGKNARQNDFLGTMFSRQGELVWLHVKYGHGAHLIIDKANPSNKEIEIGCEIALLASNLSAGEVMMAKKKEVKKGSVIGQAVLKSYTSATIKSISSKSLEAYKSERKVSL
ncbi:MAG: NFACT family protein [Bacilli bacterium]|nr:NFACT family protein [Bacilli bacterium]